MLGEMLMVQRASLVDSAGQRAGVPPHRTITAAGLAAAQRADALAASEELDTPCAKRQKSKDLLIIELD